MVSETKLQTDAVSKGHGVLFYDARRRLDVSRGRLKFGEEEPQDRLGPEPTRQYGTHLDSKLTIASKRNHVSTEPKDEVSLREFSQL